MDGGPIDGSALRMLLGQSKSLGARHAQGRRPRIRHGPPLRRGIIVRLTPENRPGIGGLNAARIPWGRLLGRGGIGRRRLRGKLLLHRVRLRESLRNGGLAGISPGIARWHERGSKIPSWHSRHTAERGGAPRRSSASPTAYGNNRQPGNRTECRHGDRERFLAHAGDPSRAGAAAASNMGRAERAQTCIEPNKRVFTDGNLSTGCEKPESSERFREQAGGKIAQARSQ